MYQRGLSFFVLAVSCLLVSCETPQFLTLTIYESPQRVVRLQAIPDANQGKGFSHPAYLTTKDITDVMQGLYVERGHSTFSLPFLSDSKTSPRHRAFSDREIKFFAPLLVKGLRQATPEEVVTFFETADISSTQARTTSGGVFVQDHAIHVLLSNYGAKTMIYQDSGEDDKGPNRLRPLEPIAHEPGRLLFEPSQYMVQTEESDFGGALSGKPWHTAVLFGKLSH